MCFSQSFSESYHYNRVADDSSSTVFDADTVLPDEVPSLPPPMPPLPALAASATATDYHHQQQNNNETICRCPHSSQESPQSFTSELLRRINSQRSPTVPSTITTATATRSEEIEISTNQSSSSSSKKRPIVTNSSVKRKQLQDNSTSTTTKKSSTKRPRRSSRLKRQQPQDQNCTDNNSDEAVINQSSSTKLTKYELRWKQHIIIDNKKRMISGFLPLLSRDHN